MKFVALLTLALFNLQCSSIDKNITKIHSTPSVLQGLTNEKSTQITVLRNIKQSHTYKIKPEVQTVVKTKSYGSNPWVVDHIKLTQLKVNTNYELTILDQKNEIVSQKKFKALDTKKTNFKISIASCMDDRFIKEQKIMWKSFIEQKSDLHFFIGDNVYGDKNVLQKGMAQPHELWQRYVDTRQTLDIYQAKQLTPTLATWDDHDYGNNGGGINYPHKKESQKIFNSFFAQEPINNKAYKQGPGVSFSFRSGGQNFYFLDNRSFRTNSKAKVDFHWGPEQQNWLLKQLNDDKRFSWLISGNQFFGAYQQFESFEKNHPNNFKKFMTQIKSLKTKVGFISGDRHLFEVMEIKQPDLNYSTIELTTSGIHAKVYPSSWGKNPNPRQLHGTAEKLNFATLELKTIPGGTNIKILGFGPNSEVFYRLNKTIK